VRDGIRPPSLTTEEVWNRLIAILKGTHKTFATGKSIKESVFFENGGAFNFEGIVEGPIEGATPECRGALQTLLYQRAQESLLLEALPEVERGLCADYELDIELGLVRNARDVEGNLYGPQENYDVEAAGPILIGLVRAMVVLGLMVLVPIYLVLTPLTIAGFLLTMIGARLIDHVRQDARLSDRFENFMADPEKVERSPLWLFTLPVMAWSFIVLGRLLHRRARRDLLPHLVSRIAIIGSGAVLDDGSFALSERAPFVSRLLTRVGPEAVERSLFELGHIFKAYLVFPVDRKLVPRMMQRRQRLQLSSSEANRAQTAELLKVGTTALVLDLSERGLLWDAPRLVDPVRALHAIASDPTLTVQVPLRGGGTMSALELQRWYQERAASVVASETVTSLEAKQIVTLWGEVLDTLARDPRDLVGVLDWPTKKMLLDANRDLSPQARRKIAIRYHELGAGYYERFERRGAAVELVTREDIERAKKTPPADTPAFARGHAIKNAAQAPLRYVSWERIIPEVVKRGRPQLRIVRDDLPSDDDE
jgi:Pup amidohydrolase